MIQEYLYQILTIIIILTFIIIYFLIKSSRQKEISLLHDISPKNDKEIQEIQTTSILEERLYKDKDKDFKFINTEEGSFGSIANNPFEHITPATINRRKRNKIEVPAHGKISKENFKEFKGVKLLVTEDNMINQKVISALLSGSGIEITMADNGKIALDILENNDDFNIILMDARMPIMNGFEATKKIKANKNYQHIVVIALSGDISPDDIKKMTDVGMEEHLEKPLKMSAFYDILYAYTKGNIEENQVLKGTNTKELNVEQGLEVCGGDNFFYKDILNDFVHNYTNITQELTKHLDENNEILADAMLLDFIGITANIGAINIHNIALELKETIKDIQERSYITLLEEFEQHLQILLRDIKRYV